MRLEFREVFDVVLKAFFEVHEEVSELKIKIREKYFFIVFGYRPKIFLTQLRTELSCGCEKYS